MVHNMQHESNKINNKTIKSVTLTTVGQFYVLLDRSGVIVFCVWLMYRMYVVNIAISFVFM